MKNMILDIADNLGLTTVFVSITMNITEIINIQSWNKFSLWLTSVLGVVYLIIKIYYSLILIRKEKKLNKNDTIKTNKKNAERH